MMIQFDDGGIAGRFAQMAHNLSDAARDGGVAAVEVIRAEIPSHVNSTTARGREPYASTFNVRGESNPPAGILWTDAPYARILEYGISRTVRVRNYRRQGKIDVASHSKGMHLPPRRILGRSLAAAREPAITAAFAVIGRLWSNAG